MAAAALLTVPADATPIGTYSYRNAATGKCLDIRAASGDDGAVLQQFACKSGGQQDFSTRSAVGETSSDVRAVHSGEGVEPVDSLPGGLVVQRGCTNSWARRWELVELGNQSFTVRTVATGLCLDDGGMPSGRSPASAQPGRSGSRSREGVRWRGRPRHPPRRSGP
ncbi:RICIN domain-containing protein [Streptomyces huiliensis]|uniref:RICIN domain-containing protein n=1 Tax=Streptomyces huiliensis TaxID=2876027 RepID=UPI001CBE12CC|nr:RICIN domain-containing protein [Streptomyces huiliensis]MBZ4320457.1 RICIN domain-containing protein [Streptomyces huiliensis]